jgi:hypothetical protein
MKLVGANVGLLSPIDNGAGNLGETNLRFLPSVCSRHRIRYWVVLTRHDGLETRQGVEALAGKSTDAGGSRREEVVMNRNSDGQRGGAA